MELQLRTVPVKRGLNTKKRRNPNPRRIIFAISILALVIWAGTNIFDRLRPPTLIGKWVSEETGKTVQFTKKGTVKVDHQQEGTYTLNDNGQMQYDIGGHSFEMYYEIQGRQLAWGIDKNELEIFHRK